MKKIFAFILSILTAISLCGCNAEKPEGPPDSDIENSTNESSTTTESSQNSTAESTPVVSEPTESEPKESEPDQTPEPDEPEEFVLKGPDGKAIPMEDYISVHDVWGKEFPMSELSDHADYYIVRAKGAYVYLPTKICRTSLDNADVFDSGSYRFSDMPTERGSEIFRVAQGDEICGYTVKSATSDFIVHDSARSIYNSVALELEGKTELTGYMSIQPEDVYGVSAGDIKFIPSDCEINLPVVDIYEHLYIGMMDDIVYFNEYGRFYLGNADTVTVDLTGIPNDNSYVKVKVTVDNIKLSIANEILLFSGNITELTIL